MRGARIAAVAGAIVASAIASHSYEGESAAQYWAKERGQVVQPFGVLPKRIKTSGNDLAVILSVTRKKGIPDSLAASVCHIESRCRLNATGPQTKHGRHFGPYQIRPSSARQFGYRGGSLQGMAGLEYGAAHLANCWRLSGGSEAKAARCHVAGAGAITGKRLAPWAERYAQQYTRQVTAARTPVWAGRLQIAWAQ